jgi:hypothetical protein
MWAYFSKVAALQQTEEITEGTVTVTQITQSAHGNS